MSPARPVDFDSHDCAMDMTNPELSRDVRAALDDDPRLPCADEIAIAVDDRAVTLRGTVGSFRPAPCGDRLRPADARRGRGPR